MAPAYATNSPADANLQYLTVDTMDWATGHLRPRMAIELKRTKHRVHQQQFMARQRERMKQLQSDVRRYTLQLQILEATKEAAALIRENNTMQIQAGSYEALLCHENTISRRTSGNRVMPFRVDCEESPKVEMPHLVPDEEVEKAAIQELLDVMPDVSFFPAESPVEVDAFSWWRSDRQVEPRAWPSSPFCATSMKSLVI